VYTLTDVIRQAFRVV